MIEYFEKEVSGGGVKKNERFKKGCWVKVIDPSEEELNFLVNEFKIDKDCLHDGLDIYETPRLEEDEGRLYIYLTVPTERIKHEHISSFLAIQSKDFFITVSKYDLEIFDKLIDSHFKKFGIFYKSRRILKVLFLISRSFELSVRKIIKEIKENKTDLEKLNNSEVSKLIYNEDKLNSYITPFETMIGNYHKVMKNKLFKFEEADVESIEDLIIDLNQTLGLCKYNLKTISNMRTYYSTKLSNDLNRTVTLLTVFTIFLAIPTIISSIYGMNIILPLQTSVNLFYFLSGFIILLWIILFSVLKYYKII